MHYQSFDPHTDLSPLVKCYWTLEVPADNHAEPQRIIPDGCIEMIFTLGDDIKRFTTDTEFIIQPRAMILGHTLEPFFIQPMGYVNTFAVRFYPYGFTSFVAASLKDLANKETPITFLFGEDHASTLTERIVHASDTVARIQIVEDFLLERLKRADTISNIVQNTVEALLSSRGTESIGALLQNDPSKRRRLERRFLKEVGISPKQLGKVIRLQAALRLLLNHSSDSLTQIAYEGEYYDQAHFIRDFKEFTGISPGAFLNNSQMALSSLFYRND